MNASLSENQIRDLATLRTPPRLSTMRHPNGDAINYAWDVVVGRAQAQRDRYAIDGNRTPAMDMMLSLMRERDVHGEAKYGVRLEPFNGQDPLREAIQEALDLCAYLANEHTERGDLAASMELDLAIHLTLRLVTRHMATRSQPS